MEFNKQMPEWVNKGDEPSEELKSGGFVLKDKPPANVFNWFFALVTDGIKELQDVFSSLTPDKLGAASKDHKHSLGDIDNVVRATSTDGEVYYATVDGITELYNGLELTIIPNKTSTKTAVQFSLNGFGAKNLRAKLNGYNNGNSGTTAALAGWIGENVPLTIRYVEKFDSWQTVDFSRPSASGLYGTIKPHQGGTGISNTEGITAGNFLVGNGTDEMLEKTPAEVLDGIKALPLDGHKSMTGDLVIEKDYPFIRLNHKSGASGVVFGTHNNRARIMSQNTFNDEENVREFELYNSEGKSDIAEALFLRDVVNGVSTSYKIYGEHNLPNIGGSASGTYMGDNSNNRRIDVGGKGDVVLIIRTLPTSKEEWITFVTPVGAFEIKEGSTASSYFLNDTYLNTNNMQLVIGNGNAEGVNLSGCTYHYYVM